MPNLVDALAPNGRLIVIGAAFDPIEGTPIQLITGSRAIQGWSMGTPADSEDTLRFAEMTGVRPMIETYPFEKVGGLTRAPGELDYRLIKELWAFDGNRIAVRFAYEWRDDSGQWYRSYGNENWEFNENGLMRLRFASINDLPIKESERKYHWPLGWTSRPN